MKCLGLLLLALFVSPQLINAQDSDEKSIYAFTDKVVIPATSVKNQYRSGTCWCFSSMSFFESEAVRMGKAKVETIDLAEMFIVNRDYYVRAIDYVRWNGAKSFSAGAESSNALDRMNEFGLVPQSIYPGLNYGTDKPQHGELDALTKAYVETIVKNPNHKLSSVWIKGFDGILSAYLGEVPTEFEYEGKKYTPQSYRESLGLDARNYIEITSFTHHPFYTSFIFEAPDNWSLSQAYNVKIDELLDIAFNALDNGYSVLWGGDVSEDGFSFTHGLAIIPDNNPESLKGTDRDKLNGTEAPQKPKLFKEIVPEMEITQEMRQEAFDNFETTDDHGMHIVGYALDKNGKRYFKVKNSWDSENLYGGYHYMSESFFKYKTMTIAIHKDALPSAIKKKLNIK